MSRNLYDARGGAGVALEVNRTSGEGEFVGPAQMLGHVDSQQQQSQHGFECLAPLSDEQVRLLPAAHQYSS